MGTIIPINAALTPVNITDITTDVGLIEAIIAGMVVSLNKSQERSMIHVAVTRVAEIQDVNNDLVKVFSAATPSNFKTALYNQQLLDLVGINNLLTILQPMMNTVMQAKNVLENNLMVQTNQILETSKTEGKTDSNLATAYNKIAAKYFDNQTNKKVAAKFDLLASSTVTIAKVITKRVFVNTGTTVITINKVNGPISDIQSVNPSGSIKIPVGWTNVVITNMSATDKAFFSIFLKK